MKTGIGQSKYRNLTLFHIVWSVPAKVFLTVTFSILFTVYFFIFVFLFFQVMRNFQRQPADRKKIALLFKSSYLDNFSSSYLGGVPNKGFATLKNVPKNAVREPFPIDELRAEFVRDISRSPLALFKLKFIWGKNKDYFLSRPGFECNLLFVVAHAPRSPKFFLG